MCRALAMAFLGAILFTVLCSPGDGLPRVRRGWDWIWGGSGSAKTPAPIRETPDSMTRAPCVVLPYEQGEGLQYTEASLEVASGGPDTFLGVLKPGNYSYSGSYAQPDPCRYD